MFRFDPAAHSPGADINELFAIASPILKAQKSALKKNKL